VITAIRDARNKNQLKPKDPVKLHIQAITPDTYKSIESILSKQVNASQINYVKGNAENTIALLVQKDKFFIESEKSLDASSQKEQLLKDLEYFKGFLMSIEKKLSNEKFIQNAKPQILEIERKKKADAEHKIKAIEESLNQF
jgi:valyl-tRNA synthetase